MKAVIFTHVFYLILMKSFTVKGVPKCESKVELRAVMLSCPAKDSGCDEDDPLTQAMKSEEFPISHSNGFDPLREKKDRGFPDEVKDCKRKLVISLKIKNAGKIPCDDEYIVVDHVFDPVTGGRGRLLFPVVVKLRQEQMIQLYRLHFQRVVNSDPFEEQKADEKTCSVDPENPTCGMAMYDGKPIPFSEGFCCSSDAHVNVKRQLPPVSDGDSLLPRYSKQTPRARGRLVRENHPERTRTILNPELVMLKSGTSDGMSGDEKGSDCGAFGDPLCWDRVPNYLLENDRKIVCDRGDFVKELCRLRESKIQAEATTTDKNGKAVSRRSGTKSDPAAEIAGFSTSDFLQSSDDVPILKRVIEKLNAKRKTSSTPLSDGNRSRGKRENKESEKLSLEEKLDRFLVNSKKQSKNRRKRLLELSHDRFRKAGGSCQERSENQGCRGTECAKSVPPRYFFSHDKSIIDPLEIVNEANSTYKTSVVDRMREDPFKRRRYHPPETKDLFGNKKLVDRTFARGQLKNGSKLRGKDNVRKFKLESVDGSREETIASKGGRRFNNHRRITETVKGGNEVTEVAKNYEETAGGKEGEKAKGGERCHDQMSQLNTKRFKNLLHKSELNKKLANPKMKNMLLFRNRDQQKLIRGHKTAYTLSHKQVFDGRKLKESSMKNLSEMQSERLQGRNVENGGEREKEKLKAFESLQNSNLHRQDTEKTETGLLSLRKENVGKKNRYNEKGTNHLREPAKKKKLQKGCSFSHNDKDTNVNFDVEIIRSKVPMTSQQTRHPFLPQMLTKNRVSPDLNTNIYDANGKPEFLLERRQHSLPLRNPSVQNYFVLENEKVFPQVTFPESNARGRFPATENSLRFHGLSKNLMNKAQPGNEANIYKKSARRGYGSESEADFAMPRRPFLSIRVNEPQELPERAKRDRREDEWKVGSESAPKKGWVPSVRNKRSTLCLSSFRPARVYRGSELNVRKSNEGVTDEGTITKKGGDALASEGVLFQPEHENCSVFDRRTFSGLPELLRGLNYPMRGSQTEIDEEESIKATSDKRRLIRSYANAPAYVLEEVDSSLKGKRQAKGRAAGGEHGQDTAHCMRFGDMWYSMYSLKQPVISQIAGVQLFDKHSAIEGTSQWRDLTKGKMIRVGTFLTKAADELPSVSITFAGDKSERVDGAIDTDNYYLLVPSHVSDPSKVNSYPQFEGGPAEYLLVQSKDVSSGGECNTIGTSFEAFARQADRCTRPRGSCLKRQPIDLWREDMEARIRGRRGKYFVENFGSVPNSPVKTFTNLTGEFLALEYYGEYTSTIDIEMKADSNAIIRKGSTAQIPMVYVDGTYPKKMRIILSVLNVGLTSSYFRPRLGDCPPGLDPALCPLEGPLVIIPPQQRHLFKLDLSGTLPSGKNILTVQVLSQINKPIALRKIIVKRGDRCVCAFHCKCNCFGNSGGGRTCRRLSLEEYWKAGYVGSYPFRGGPAVSAHECILGNFHIIFLTASYVLLLLGVMKGILGIFFRRIGIAGTRIITGPRELCGYYECELLGCSVVYSESGFPVHPTTCQPVQIVPLWLEVIINILFFFLYPLRGIWFLILSLPCSRGFCFDFDGYCQNDEGDCNRKSSSPLLSKKPNFSSVHYNLTTVDSKKSKQDHLPYPPYDGDDDPLEEDDTEFVLQEMKRYRRK